MSFLENFLRISTWQSGVFILCLVIAIGIIIAIRRITKSSTLSLFAALLLGLGIAVSFSSGNGFMGTESAGGVPLWAEEIAFWGDIITIIFYNSISILLPFVLFASISSLIAKLHSKTKGVFLKGTLSLFSVFFVGILITVLVSFIFLSFNSNFLSSSTVETSTLSDPVPIADRFINIIPRSISDFFNVSDIEGQTIAGSALHGGASVSGIISSVLVGLVVGIAVRKGMQGKNSKVFEKLERGLSGFNILTNGVLKIVIAYLPIAILGFIITALFEGSLTQLQNGALFVGFMLLTTFLIILALTLINLTKVRGKNIKNILKDISKPIIVGFFSLSSQAALPLTRQSLLKELNLSKTISNVVPTFAASGLSVACTGAFPLLASLFIAKQLGFLDVGFYIEAIIVTTLLALGMAGVPGDAAVASTNVVRSLFAGRSPSLALNTLGIILSSDLISEMVRTATNIYGSITATILTDSWLKKRKKKSLIYKQHT